MRLVDESCIDILLNADGQPVPDENGEFRLVSQDECWMQDLRLEAQTEEGELFYEDAAGIERYGFGMTDFIQAEADAFARIEIEQRIKGKLDKRKYLDSRKTRQNIAFADGEYKADVTISKQNDNEEYNLQLTPEKVEVII